MTTANRRDFIKTVSSSSLIPGAVGLLAQGCVTAGPRVTRPAPPAAEQAKVRVVYIGKPVGLQGWPNLDMDPAQRAEVFKPVVQGAGVNFTGRDVVTKVEDVERIKKSLSDEDGVVAFILTSPAVGLSELLSCGKPTIMVNDLYGGDCSFLGRQKSAEGQGWKVVSVSTADQDVIARKIELLNAIHRLKKSKILCVRDSGVSADFIQGARDKLGIQVQAVTSAEVREAYGRVDTSQAEATADEWVRNARKVVEPSRPEIVDAARLACALDQIMRREQANALTIDCLTLVYGGKLPAYPCLAFVNLNDRGMVGACESDLAATTTQMIVGFIANRPGYISDPVLDTAANQIIHAHCVAATKMAGPDGPRDPHYIRSHAEDKKGVSLQVKMKVGQPITLAKYIPFDEMLISTGEIVGNVDTGDRACRTKVVTQVADARKMLNNYRGGLHRVLFYGDWVEDVEDFGRLTGIKVTHEM
jgi:L-fucose isomerase-like protein